MPGLRELVPAPGRITPAVYDDKLSAAERDLVPPLIMGPMKSLLHGAWLNRRRVFAWCAALLVLQLAILTYAVAVTHGFLGPWNNPTTTDFVSFYAAGSLANGPTPELAYDQIAHHMAERQALQQSSPYLYFYYPPVFLILCAVLARVPYLVSFLLFETVSLGLYLLVMRRVLNARGAGWLLPALAFPSVFWTLALGQNAFLTTTILGAATCFLDRRPFSAGALLGLLCYKRHFGFLVPLALACGRRWQAIAGAAMSATVLVSTSVAMFGIKTWSAYLDAFRSAAAVYESGRILFAGFVTPFGAMLLLGAPKSAAYAVQGAVTVIVCSIVAWIWARNASLPVRSASLITATLLSVPLALIYDMLPVAVAMAWLYRASQNGGWLGGEKLILGGVICIALVSLWIGLFVHVPLGPIAPALLLGLCITRTRREIQQRHLSTVGSYLHAGELGAGVSA
jgi:hypothetical protein